MKYDNMFNSFVMNFPTVAENIDECIGSTEYDITFRLKNGSIILYDYIDNSIRILPNDSRTMTMDECNKEFGTRLMQLMKRKGVTQSELGRRTGLRQNQISNYINAKNSPSFWIVDKIAKALDCSVEYFRYR